MKNAKMFMWHMAVAAALPALYAGPVHAGFEWSPPPAAPAISSTQNIDTVPAMSAVPADSVEASELMPIPGAESVSTPAEALPAPVNASVSAPVSAIPTAPAIERETRALPKPIIQEELNPHPATGPFAIAQGFGSDIPLALALGQIVPPEYAYSFAASVNPGLKISWDGGKPWNIVLNDALAVHGLRADIAGNAVVVRSMSGAHKRAAQNSTQNNAHNNTINTEAEIVPPTALTPIGAPSSSTYNTVPRPPMDAPLTLNSSADAASVNGANMGGAIGDTVGGEGSANYPRRNTTKQSFLRRIFTSDEDKGNQAPRPPLDGKVVVRNEVPADDLSAPYDSLSPQPVSVDLDPSSVEPAAPAMAPIAAPITMTSAPQALNTQKISYADESLRQNTDILPERTLSDSVRAQANILDPFKVNFWRADANENLREVLTEWAHQAGVEVIWDSGYDYKLPGNIAMHGTFPDAVTRVFDLYGNVEPRPHGKLHPNLPKGPSVLLVENYP